MKSFRVRDERGVVVWGLLFLLLVIVMVVLILISEGPGVSGTLSVTGTGVVNVKPSTVSFDVGVSENAGSATAGLNAMETAASRINVALVGAGVRAKNIQSDNVSVNAVTNSNGVVTGFNASEDVAVSVGTQLAGPALDAAARAGGNGAQLSGISWGVAANSPAYAKAREKAVADAMASASQIAAKLGKSLGSVKSVVDEGSSSNVIAPEGFVAAASGHSVPVEAGTSSVSDSVRVVFYLK